MQDIWIYLSEELRHFDETRSDLNTFARSVLEKGFPYMRRKYLKNTRNVLYGAARLDGSGGGTESPDSGTGEPHGACRPEHPEAAWENPFETAEFAESVNRCMREMQEKDLRICREIMRGKTPCGMIREGICSKRYFYEHWLPRMRTLFGEMLFR